MLVIKKWLESWRLMMRLIAFEVILRIFAGVFISGDPLICGNGTLGRQPTARVLVNVSDRRFSPHGVR